MSLIEASSISKFEELPAEICNQILREVKDPTAARVCRLFKDFFYNPNGTIENIDSELQIRGISKFLALNLTAEERLAKVKETLLTRLRGVVSDKVIDNFYSAPLSSYFAFLRVFEEEDAVNLEKVFNRIRLQYPHFFTQDEENLKFSSSLSTVARARQIRKWFATHKEAVEKVADLDLSQIGLTLIPGELALFKGLKKINISANAIQVLTQHFGKTWERMDLLDLASAMASVYRDKHNDATLADMVLAVQQKQVNEERAREAELKKWDKYEKITGNLVLKTNEAKMAGAGLTPVIYPHWVHRLYYDCKTCHQNIFKPKRGENEINMMGIFTGKKCGVCHDGKTAFSPYNDCEKCHSAGKPGAERLMDVTALDMNKVVETAARLGSSWKPEKLEGQTLPLDRFKTIDWSRLEKTGAREPVKPESEEDVSDAAKPHASRIVFDPKFDFVKRVLFDHKNHSAKLNCSTCHQSIFNDRLGGNKLSMKEMSAGKYCGACHGKVAFKLAECNRCHSLDRSAPMPAHTLTRKKSVE